MALAEACTVLKRWDGQGSTDSRGALLWELAWAAMDVLDKDEPAYEVPFSAAEPLNTPRVRKFVPERVAKVLAAARLQMLSRGLALDVPLGQVRYLKVGPRRLPLFGGSLQVGYFLVGCVSPSMTPTSGVIPRCVVRCCGFLGPDGAGEPA